MNERRHTRPDRHWTGMGKLLLQFLGAAAAFLAVLIVAELICTALGLPRAQMDLR